MTKQLLLALTVGVLFLGGRALADPWPQRVLQHSQLTSYGDADEARAGAFFDPSGRYLVTSLYQFRVWDVETGSLLANLVDPKTERYGNTFYRGEFLKGDEHFVSQGRLARRGGALYRELRLWELGKGRLLGRFQSQDYLPLAFSLTPERDKLWVVGVPRDSENREDVSRALWEGGAFQPRLELWDAFSRKMLTSWPLPEREAVLALSEHYLVTQAWVPGSPLRGASYRPKSAITVWTLGPDGPQPKRLTEASTQSWAESEMAPSGRFCLLHAKEGTLLLDLSKGTTRKLSDETEVGQNNWQLDSKGVVWGEVNGFLTKFGPDGSVDPLLRTDESRKVSAKASGHFFIKETNEHFEILDKGLRTVSKLDPHRHLVTSRDKSLIALEQADGRIAIHSTKRAKQGKTLGRRLERSGTPELIGDLLLVPNATVDHRRPHEIEVWDLGQGQMTQNLPAKLLARAGEHVLVYHQGVAKRWSPLRGEFQATPWLGEANAYFISEDGDSYAETRLGRQEYTTDWVYRGTQGRVSGEAKELSPDGRWLLVKKGQDSLIYDLTQPKSPLVEPGGASAPFQFVSGGAIFVNGDLVNFIDLENTRIAFTTQIPFEAQTLLAGEGLLVVSDLFPRSYSNRPEPRGRTLVIDLADGKILTELGSVGVLLDLSDGRLATDYGVWDLLTGRNLCRLRMAVPRFLSGGKTLVDPNGGGLDFYSIQNGSLVASAYEFDDDQSLRDWLVVTPEGFFDGSPSSWSGVRWRLSESIFDSAEPEQFFTDFYQPGLLGEILRHGQPIREVLQNQGDPRAALQLSQTDRNLPEISFTSAKARGDYAEVSLEVRQPKAGSGLKDVRLFRNGCLVKHWPGSLTERGQKLSAKVQLRKGDNQLTAYAFNKDNVRSRVARTSVRGTADARPSKTFHLGIGIDQYSNSRLNLKFAEADAHRLTAALNPGSLFETELILSQKATRAEIKDAIARLVEKAQPQDRVIISYSGHGLAEGQRFQLVTHELAKISDQDLENWLSELQAEKSVLVLDSCYSGTALEASRLGPLNNRGLAQLAYEKGMSVIAASQADQTALEGFLFEGKPVGHGLLTFALDEGLKAAPRRGQGLLVRDWLDYAASRVPQVLGNSNQTRAALLGQPANKRKARQVPRVFYRRHDGGTWAIAK